MKNHPNDRDTTCQRRFQSIAVWHLAWRTTTARKARTHRKLLFYPLSTTLSYFKRDTNGQSRFSIFAPAQEAFDQALEKLKKTSTKKWEKRRLILEATSLRDLLDLVAAAQNRYANEHTKSKNPHMYHGALKEGLLLRQGDGCTSATSSRICFARVGGHEVGIWCGYPFPIATSTNDS